MSIKRLAGPPPVYVHRDPISALENGGLFSKVLFLVAFVVFALLLIVRKSPNTTKKSSFFRKAIRT